jgi:hypothetical protein
MTLLRIIIVLVFVGVCVFIWVMCKMAKRG